MRLRWTSVSSLLVVPVGVLLASTHPSFGSTVVYVYNSFGPGNTYDTSTVWGVDGASATGGYRGQAEWFVPGISGDFTTVQLALYRASGSGRVNIYLAQDNGGGIPGTILESYLNVFSPGGVVTLTSTMHSLLQAGDKYWICAEPADATTYGGWYQNSQNVINGFAFERSPWSWSAFTDTAHSPPSGVFSLSVVPVPEPSTVGLALLGGALLARRRRGVSWQQP